MPMLWYVDSEIVKRKDAVHIGDVRDLILHIIADAPPPNWVEIEDPRAVERVVALFIPGINPSTLALPSLPTSATINPNIPLSIPLPPESRTPIPFIASTYSHACPTRAPGNKTRMYSVLSELFQCTVSGDEKVGKKQSRQAKRQAYKARRQAHKATQRPFGNTPSPYLLSLEEMIENDYPIPSYMADVFKKGPGWIETPQPSDESLSSLPLEIQHSKIYAIDCEMCLTEDGSELTRVCMIDYHSGTAVYDKLVKPQKPVVDYLTKWSGITEAMLASATTTVAQVQAHIMPFLAPKSGPPSILVGHSLEFDLRALRICHPNCIDTAIIYHHPRGRPLKPALAWLIKKWVGRKIQTRGEGGHDPGEDARACIDLLKLKLRNGPTFGRYWADRESIFERMGRASENRGGGPGSVRSAVVDHGNPAVTHGSRANSNVPCASDQEVLEGLLQVIPAHQFTFGRFTGVADALGWPTPKVTPADAPVVDLPLTKPSRIVLATAYATLNDQLIKLYASLPPKTALIIFTGHSDPRRMVNLKARKSGNGKSAKDVQELKKEVELAKKGLLFLGVK